MLPVTSPADFDLFGELDMDIAGGSPEQLTAIIRADIPKWAKVIKDSGTRLD